MTKYNYSFTGMQEHMVRAVARDERVSTKQCIELSSRLRGKRTDDAKKILEGILNKTSALPMKKFNRGGVGHRTGIGPGRYPQKSTTAVLRLLNSAIASAQFKGLNTGELKIVHMCAHRGAGRMHYGRKRRSEMKLSHVELVLAEDVKDKKAVKQPSKVVAPASTQKVTSPKEKEVSKGPVATKLVQNSKPAESAKSEKVTEVKQEKVDDKIGDGAPAVKKTEIAKAVPPKQEKENTEKND